MSLLGDVPADGTDNLAYEALLQLAVSPNPGFDLLQYDVEHIVEVSIYEILERLSSDGIELLRGESILSEPNIVFVVVHIQCNVIPIDSSLRQGRSIPSRAYRESTRKWTCHEFRSRRVYALRVFNQRGSQRSASQPAALTDDR